MGEVAANAKKKLAFDGLMSAVPDFFISMALSFMRCRRSGACDLIPSTGNRFKPKPTSTFGTCIGLFSGGGKARVGAHLIQKEAVVIFIIHSPLWEIDGLTCR